MPDLQTIDLATVDASIFRPHVDSTFTLHHGADRVLLRLTDIADYPERRAKDGAPLRKPFGLVFHSEKALLVQGTYPLEHPELPACEIFLSPFEGGDGWCKLEAIFN